MAELRATPFDDLEPGAVLRVQDVAARLLVDARSIRRAIQRGDLPASRACGLRVLAADAAEWWRGQAVHPIERPRRFSSGERLPLPPRERRA